MLRLTLVAPALVILVAGAASTTGCSERCLPVSAGVVCGATDVTVPVAHEGGWAVVEGSVDDRPARILLDTAAGGTFVSASLVGAESGGWQRIESICVGTLCVQDMMAWAEDTEITPAAPGPDRVHAIIGTDVLRDAVLELDHGATIRLAFGAQACPGTEVTLTLDDNARPFAPVRLNGVDAGDALIDTGSRYSLLSAAQVDAAGGLGETRPSELCTIDGCFPAEIGTLNELCVADLCAADVTVKTPGSTIVGDSYFNQGRYAFELGAETMVRCDP